MDFEKRKAATMAAISSTELDKSPKGTIDAPIIPLLTTINNHPSYFTTSSCSGRISIFSHLPNKPKGGSWLFISHDPVNPSSILNLIFPPKSHLSSNNNDDNNYNNDNDEGEMLVMRFEPLIIAVECKDVGSAQNLVSIGISSGFRESGITSVSSKRVIVAIRCSIRLEVPLGCKGGILVTKEYLKFLVDIANDKMELNWKRTQGFLEGLRKNGFVGPVDSGADTDTDAEGGGGLVGLSGGSAVSEEGRWLNAGSQVSNFDGDSGSTEVPGPSLIISPIEIVGENAERLFLWGHSSCTSCNSDRKEILIYGGFGGIGRHARRNDCLLLNPSSGRFSVLDVKGSPSPRMGHTSSTVGGLMIVIGGRADPTNILDEVWILNIAKAEWKLVGNTGDTFAPRHRHAAVVVGSKIYVFGGLNGDTLYSSLVILDVDSLKWIEVHAGGDCPCARHSHSMVAYGDKLYLFGGYNGEKPLGDLYSFSIQDYRWENFKTVGKVPYPRFSHSMFVYKHYLGIVGGCPVRQHCEELSLLDLQTLTWKHVLLNSVGKQLFVRSTANIVDDDLIMIGGGAACYAFGTKFSEPSKINLLPLVSLSDATVSSTSDEKQGTLRDEDTAEKRDSCFGLYHNGSVKSSELGTNLDVNGQAPSREIENGIKTSYWVVKLQKRHAKWGKDILKKFGWLDLGRKAYSHEDGSCIYFPVTEKFSAIFSDELSKERETLEEFSDLHMSKDSIDSRASALNFLVACGATKHIDELVAMKKTPVSPMEALKKAVASLLEHKGLSEGLLEELPLRWERLGDIVVLPITSFRDPAWDTIGSDLWSTVARTLSARRLARQGRVASTGTRDSRLEILVGDNGWVEHLENGIVYCFDATKCMFSWGNLSEKLRVGRLDCRGEIVVDLFAGIGYFTLPFLVRAQAKLVYACEWNPYAVEALQHNLKANMVSDRCVVLEGDNRLTAPKEVADRVSLGLLPSSEGSWATGVRALRCEGGTLHIHGNVKDSEESQWTQHVINSISELARTEGRQWKVSLVHLERVKWYAPHIRHLVADIKCEHTTDP